MEKDEVKLSKLDQLKTAITDFVNTDINELRDASRKTEFVDNFKTIMKADDSGVYSWLEKVLPFMKTEANALGIVMDAKAEFTPENETPEPPVTEEPVADETPTDEVPPETPEVPVKESRMTRGEYLIESANQFID
jgi:hypothetical protein